MERPLRIGADPKGQAQRPPGAILCLPDAFLPRKQGRRDDLRARAEEKLRDRHSRRRRIRRTRPKISKIAEAGLIPFRPGR